MFQTTVKIREHSWSMCLIQGANLMVQADKAATTKGPKPNVQQPVGSFAGPVWFHHVPSIFWPVKPSYFLFLVRRSERA